MIHARLAIAIKITARKIGQALKTGERKP